MNDIGSDGHAARWAVDRLREAVEQALIAQGEPPATPDELRRLQREGPLNIEEQGGASASQLADTIQGWRQDSAANETSGRHQEGGEDAGGTHKANWSAQPRMIPMGGLLPDDPALARQHAVSRVLAAGLVDDLTIWEPIARFRQLHVGETLLAWDAVEGWIEAQQPGDTFRPHTYWLSDIPISPEQIERGIATAPEGHTALSLTITVPVPWTDHPYNARSGSIGRLEAKQVQYLIPGVEDPRWAYVKAGSALDVLLDLSERLVPADPHDPHADNTLRPWWTKAQASTFVLTGLAPVVTRYKAIHLDLDPTTPLEQIMAQVAAARLALVGKRARELSPKHLHLAVFSTERPEEPWAMRLEAWNTTYPHWAYPPESRSNFIRDSLTAKRRLLLQEHE